MARIEYKVGQVVKRALVAVALWLESVAVRFRERIDHCALCGMVGELSACPCGNRVCEACQDYGIYSDEVCCELCAGEIRQGWIDCPEHVYGTPYTNEVGAEIVECEKCSFTKFALPTCSVCGSDIPPAFGHCTSCCSDARPLTKREIGG